MCLIIDETKYPDLQPRIAQEDMIVYKVVLFDKYYVKEERKWYAHLRAPFKRSFIYKTNTTYGPVYLKAVNMMINRIEDVRVVNEGFHSYKSKIQTLWLAKRIPNMKVFEAVIPKGSEYFEGTYEDLVSSHIILKQRCDHNLPQPYIHE